MDKKTKLSILSVFVAAALLGSVIAYGENMAYAGGDNHGKTKKSNDALQLIEQYTTTAQDSTCDSGKDTKFSCNNVAVSVNYNNGSNALGQQ